MKKLLSAVLMMMTIVAAATLTGSVLAAEPYEYIPEDGSAVVYVSNSGEVNKALGVQEFTDIGTAVSTIGKTGGYVILLENIDMDGQDFGSNASMVTIRGRDDLGENVVLENRHMRNTAGPITFEYVDIQWVPKSSADNDNSLQIGNHKLVMGEGVTTKANKGPTLTGADITIMGGTFGIRLATWGSNASYPELNVTVDGGTLSSLYAAWSGPGGSSMYGSRIVGDVNITLKSGTINMGGIAFQHVNNNIFTVGGNYNVKVTGGNFSGSFKPVTATPKEFAINGDTIVDLTEYTGDKAAMAAKFSASDWDLVMANTVYVSENGSDDGDGTASAPYATYEKAVAALGAAGGVVSIDGTLTVGGEEATRTAPVIFANGTLVVDGDFVLGGKTVVKSAVIKNGAAGAIVANGNAFTIMSDVTTEAGADGKYIDIVAGKRDELVVSNVTINAGTYNNIIAKGLAGSKVTVASGVRAIGDGVSNDAILNALNITKSKEVANAVLTLSEFVDAQAAKVVYASTEAAEASIALTTGSSKVNGDTMPFVRLEYYLAGDASFIPALVIGENEYKANEASKKGWNLATFDISGAGEFKEFTFLPFGEATALDELTKLYINTLTFSHYKDTSAISYAEPNLSSKNDFIPVLDDYVMTVEELVNTSNLKNLIVQETPFVAGAATKYIPDGASNIYADYYTLKDGGIITLNGEFQPYVRIEYYMYAREGEEFTGNPTIVIGENEYVATEPLAVNKWAVATFNIKDNAEDFKAFKFYPYGNAEGLNAWNKLYVQQIIFSQTENTAVREYPVPEMTEEGEIIPYEYIPEDGKPVVYVATGGVYNGSVAGSTDSTKAYGTLADAFKAIDSDSSVTEAIVIILNDMDCAGGLPAHTKMITVRGRENEDNSKEQLMFRYMASTNGPITLENLALYWYSHTDNSDLALASYTSKLVVGKKGVENDVTYSNWRGDTSLTLTGTEIEINSGTFGIRFGEWGQDKTFSAANITLNGGTLGHIKGCHDRGSTVINGNVKITINGGKLGSSFVGLGNSGKYTKLNGNYDLVITGGDFSAVTNKISTVSGGSEATSNIVTGTKTVDILEYNGDFEALKAKIDLNAFDILNVNSIYLTNGGTGNGTPTSSPFGSLADAVAACVKDLGDGRVEGGRIVICGTGFTVEGDVAEIAAPATGESQKTHPNTILYTSVNNAPLTFESGSIILQGPAKFSNITLKAGNADAGAIVANGFALELSDSVKTAAYEGEYVDIVGGNLDETVASTNVTVNGGTYGDVITGGSVEGDVNVVFNGGKVVGTVVGGSSAEGGVIGGAVTIVINDGEFAGKIIGGNNATDAVIERTVYIDINGGKFTKDCTILATNENATATVGGNAEVNISGGDFSAMTDGQIQPGSGVCGDKTCVDYEQFRGNANELKNKVSTTFDVIIELKQSAPVFTEADRFIFIIQHIGDPTKALTKTIPFKITQSVKQTSAPIVVSPKQLNLKMDGSDHANMTLQTVKDTVDTIRFVSNPNPTKGNSIVVDGYNINGRGVDVSKYKYIEVVYYYTVPEGETPAVQNMAFRPLSDHSSAGTGTSETLVPNKWTTTLIDMSSNFEGMTGNLKQYHFSPMGNGKKNTDVPVTQYLDIASLTFYTDKPSTTIVGGNAPSMKAVAQEEAATPAAPAAPKKIEDIVVDVVNLKSTVDNSGSFTSAQVVKDGVTVMEYTPNTSSDKDLRIEGYNCMGKAISLNEYQYLTMKVMVETKRTDVTFKTQVINCNGGVADNPEKAKGVTWTADTALVPNEWTTVTLKIAPDDPAFHITRQFHIAPIGVIKGNTMQAGEKFYLAEFVLSNKPPKSAGSAAEGEEVVEVEQEVIAESPAIVVDGAKLINSAGNFPTFKSTVGEFDGKKVVMVKPNSVAAPVSIDGAAIFGKTEQTPESALNLKTHRYAIISYYYASASEAERIPEFDLLGGRIQDKIGVVNGITAKGTEGLKRNEWATAVVKLSGNGAGSLASGFNLKPFGDVAAEKLDTGDVLYIENITFVSNRP